MDKLLVTLLALGFVVLAQAHMSIYTPGMWGSQPGDPNANWAVQPLQDLSFNDWWWHGPKSVNDPPAANAVYTLHAGGTNDFEITGNKRFTSMGDGLWVKPGSTPRSIPDPWSNDMGGYGSSNIHAPAYKDVAGCALGIAYKSNQNEVKPTDFVIFSVVHDCIARQLQAFDIPALPACPNGKCICGWFWIHNSIGGTDQMYMTAFQCNVTNPSKNTILKPAAPVRCDGQKPCYLYPNWGNATNVCPKALNPLYWANEGGNIFNPTNSQCAPTYNTYYGFPDGAQHQIFANAPEAPRGSVGDILKSGEGLSSEEGTILVSPHMRTKLAVQQDGNVVLVDVNSGKVHWSTNTAGQGVGPFRLVLNNVGNLVLSDSQSTILWSSNTVNKGPAPYRLKLKDIVSLKLVDRDSSPLWEAPATL